MPVGGTRTGILRARPMVVLTQDAHARACRIRKRIVRRESSAARGTSTWRVLTRAGAQPRRDAQHDPASTRGHTVATHGARRVPRRGNTPIVASVADGCLFGLG